MGYRPIPPRTPPTRESFHLGMARSAFVKGALDVAEFEASVEHVLLGGTLHSNGRIAHKGDLPSLPDQALVSYVEKR